MCLPSIIVWPWLLEREDVLTFQHLGCMQTILKLWEQGELTAAEPAVAPAGAGAGAAAAPDAATSELFSGEQPAASSKQRGGGSPWFFWKTENWEAIKEAAEAAADAEGLQKRLSASDFNCYAKGMWAELPKAEKDSVTLRWIGGWAETAAIMGGCGGKQLAVETSMCTAEPHGMWFAFSFIRIFPCCTACREQEGECPGQ